MAAPLRILCLHGIGNHRDDLTWQDRWTRAIRTAVTEVTAGTGREPRPTEIHYCLLDDIFDEFPLKPEDWVRGAAILASSAVWYWGRGPEEAAARGRLSYVIRWYAGMVAQWSANAQLRRRLRQKVRQAMQTHQADVVAAHSLGSLIAFDLLMELRASPPRGTLAPTLAAATFLSFGSQIGHPSVRSIFGGRIVMPTVGQWFHLFNPRDNVFTAPIALPAEPKFRQIVTLFDLPGDIGNHDAAAYLAHLDAKVAWQTIAAPPAKRTVARRELTTAARARRRPKHRALLVGINEYDDPANNLEGCVNDAFLVSSLLQELGFPAEDIRMVLDARATAAAIRERLMWLLEDVQPGDIRFFHYSGHGAQIPAYGEGEVVDRLDECLVPYDFDWTSERAIVDDWFCKLYSQIPYGATFIANLDCCHSGGMARGTVRVRGLTPPDDIRHRLLRWNPELETWEPRPMKPIRSGVNPGKREQYVGQSGAVIRFGRAVPLRQLSRNSYLRTRSELDHSGPYLPLLLEACQENELAEEHRQGNTPYGAFTLTFVQTLRAERRRNRRPTPEQLIRRVRTSLRKLGHFQVPAILGPDSLVKKPFAWG
jgi:hypothetical protein